jgi:hypothetical protein
MHCAYPPVITQDEVERPPQPTRGYEATVASTSNMHDNIGHSAARPAPSLFTSTTALNISNNDKTGPWIWRSSRLHGKTW